MGEGHSLAGQLEAIAALRELRAGAAPGPEAVHAREAVHDQRVAGDGRAGGEVHVRGWAHAGRGHAVERRVEAHGARRARIDRGEGGLVGHGDHGALVTQLRAGRGVELSDGVGHGEAAPGAGGLELDVEVEHEAAHRLERVDDAVAVDVRVDVAEAHVVHRAQLQCERGIEAQALEERVVAHRGGGRAAGDGHRAQAQSAARGGHEAVECLGAEDRDEHVVAHAAAVQERQEPDAAWRQVDLEAAVRGHRGQAPLEALAGGRQRQDVGDAARDDRAALRAEAAADHGPHVAVDAEDVARQRGGRGRGRGRR